MGKYNSSLNREKEIKKIELEQKREDIVDELTQIIDTNRRESNSLRERLIYCSSKKGNGEAGNGRAKEEIEGLVDEKNNLQEKVQRWQKLYEEGRYEEYFKMEEKEIGDVYMRLSEINKKIKNLESYITGGSVEEARSAEDEAYIKRVEREDELRVRLRSIDDEIENLFSGTDLN